MHPYVACRNAFIEVDDKIRGGGCGICYEFFTNLTSTTLAAKTTDA
jgi:hypothetical protein